MEEREEIYGSERRKKGRSEKNRIVDKESALKGFKNALETDKATGM